MTIPPHTCLKTSLLNIFFFFNLLNILQCLLNVLTPLLSSLPHGLEVISTSLLTLNFIHFPKSTSPVLNRPRFLDLDDKSAASFFFLDVYRAS